MSTRYKVILSNNNFYKEIELTADSQQVKAGTGVECDVRLRKELFFGKVELAFVKNNSEWMVLCSDNLYFTAGDIRKLITKSLKHGDVLQVKYQESDNLAFSLEFYIDFDDGNTKYERIIDTSGFSTITIGSSAINTIVLGSQYVGDDSLILSKQGGALVLEINQSTYGVYMNGKKAKSKDVIKDGDFLSVADYFFYFKGERIWTQIRTDMKVNSLKFVDRPEQNNYPKFNRNTRIKTVVCEDKIEILDPPAKPQEPKGGIVTRLLPSLIMVVSGLAMSMISPFMLISSGIGVVTAIIGLIQSKKDYNCETKERIEKYSTYVANKRNEIEGCRKQEQSELEAIYVSQKTEEERVSSFSPDLFERSPKDEDFLCVRLGSGDIKARREVNYKKQEKLEIEDELQLIPQQICDEYVNVHNAPIVCNLTEVNAIGVVGVPELRFEVFENIVIDIATRHYFSDVQMIFIAEQANKEQIQWLRMLPHAYNDLLGVRNVVSNDESRNIIFEYLYKELTAREQRKPIEQNIVVFFYDEYGFKSHPISKFMDHAKDLGVTFVFFGNCGADIPQGCGYVVEIKNRGKAVLNNAENKSEAAEFSYPYITMEQAQSIVNILAPIYTEEISLEGTLTKNITLFELLNILTVDDIDLESRWRSSQVYKSMAAPLGVSKTGVVTLDLHDKAHGPHGLVAGTTGSGKSEILQTYILAMTTLFHPYEVAFVIIDFKGGGMVNQFKELPHLLGAITNIDGKEINRSLKSIKAELQKRQRLFAEADVNHIDKYIRKFKNGEVSIPLPHLIIIVDEFAELKAEQPEFMKELISAARIGRSLGVHLILATQKPSGQVNEQIWSNSRFKLCLKVQSQEDSNEVIKSPLAAEIKEPGRAYLQVGNNEIFELFQSAYSGASEKMDDSNVKEFTIYGLNESGKRIPVYSQKKKKSGEGSATQLDAIVRYVTDYCNNIKLAKLQNICLPTLKTVIEYRNDLDSENEVPVGIYDDPDNQLQAAYGINVFSENTMIVGSSMTGKTNLLQSIIKGVAIKFTPNEVSIYIIDFASMVLKNFEKLPHVGGVVVSNEDEKLKNLFKLLNEEILSRKEKLLSAGVSNFMAYKEAGNTDLSQIVLLVDNLTMLKDLCFAEDDFLLPICRDGISVGISVVIANPQTSGIGYKYFSNINQRICFYCNDQAEYHSVFDHCRIQPDNTPGRCLVQLNKEIYEAQTYISFNGEKEFERVQEISKFVAEISEKYNARARKIPVIPEILLEAMLVDEYGVENSSNGLVIGLNFADVSPVVLDFLKQEVLFISGGYHSSKQMFISYLKKSLIEINADLRILDDYSGTFADASNASCVSLYSKSSEDIVEMLNDFKSALLERYTEREMHGLSAIKKMDPLVLVMNSADAVGTISGNKEALEIYKEIIKKYKNLGSLIIFTSIENETISYSSPEILKMMKDNHQLVLFDDLSNAKLFECPLSLLKKYKGALKENEAFFLSGKELKKIKTVLSR